jgi:hypothetical protein
LLGLPYLFLIPDVNELPVGKIKGVNMLIQTNSMGQTRKKVIVSKEAATDPSVP